MNNGKAIIENTHGSYKVIIPSKKNWFVLIFLTVWMSGWFWGFKSAVYDFGLFSDNGIDTFMLIWITGWTFGGIAATCTLLWGYFGKETLHLGRQDVLFSKTIFGIGSQKTLDRKDVKNFRFEKINDSMFGGNRWAIYGMGPGKVQFDYGFKTYSFALSVDDAEANYLVDELRKRTEI